MFRFALVALACIAPALVAPSVVRAETIRVAAAISLKESLQAIEADYENASGDQIEFTFGASGQLAMQIQNGAPIDLFISASMKQIDELVASGRVRPGSAQVVAGNQLVLIAPVLVEHPPTSFAALAEPSVGRIAVGEPVSVPAGEYAAQVFASLSLEAALKNKLVYGANVRQVLAYVERGEVSAGIVYLSDAIESREKVKVIATADPAWHRRIVYPAVALKESPHPAAATQLLAHLHTETFRSVLRSRGFTVPAEPSTRSAEPVRTGQ